MILNKWEVWHIINTICIAFSLHLIIIKNDNIIKSEKGGVK